MQLFERAEKADAPLAGEARFLFTFGARGLSQIGDPMGPGSADGPRGWHPLRHPRVGKNSLGYWGRRVIRSVSVPSAETDLYFSVTLTAPTMQPAALHEILPLPIFVLSTEPVTAMVTPEPAQTGMR